MFTLPRNIVSVISLRDPRQQVIYRRDLWDKYVVGAQLHTSVTNMSFRHICPTVFGKGIVSDALISFQKINEWNSRIVFSFPRHVHSSKYERGFTRNNVIVAYKYLSVR